MEMKEKERHKKVSLCFTLISLSIFLLFVFISFLFGKAGEGMRCFHFVLLISISKYGYCLLVRSYMFSLVCLSENPCPFPGSSRKPFSQRFMFTMLTREVWSRPEAVWNKHWHSLTDPLLLSCYIHFISIYFNLTSCYNLCWIPFHFSPGIHFL